MLTGDFTFTPMGLIVSNSSAFDLNVWFILTGVKTALEPH